MKEMTIKINGGEFLFRYLDNSFDMNNSKDKLCNNVFEVTYQTINQNRSQTDKFIKECKDELLQKAKLIIDENIKTYQHFDVNYDFISERSSGWIGYEKAGIISLYLDVTLITIDKENI